jgi:hypothetical protein
MSEEVNVTKDIRRTSPFDPENPYNEGAPTMGKELPADFRSTEFEIGSAGGISVLIGDGHPREKQYTGPIAVRLVLEERSASQWMPPREARALAALLALAADEAEGVRR